MTQIIKANLTADGNSVTEIWRGGKGYFNAFGTFGGGTAKLQYSLDNGTTWVDMGTDTTITASGGGTFDQADCLIRVNLASATSPNLQAIVTKVYVD